jgi:hypothetical protein
MIFDTLIRFCSLSGIIFAYIFLISFMLWMVVDAAKNDRFWWIVIMISIPVAGSIIYYLAEKRGSIIRAKKS